jgi:hypothetical protein
MSMKPPESASDIAVAKVAEIDVEIAEVDQVIAEAQSTIDDAQAKRNGLLAVRNALSQLITSKEQTPPVAPVFREVSVQHNIPRVLLAVHHDGKPSKPHLGAIVSDGLGAANLADGNASGITINTGFREAVRSVLKEHPKGLKPAEVIDVMKQRHDLAKYTSRVKFKDRVYSELYALKQSEQVSKRYGRYVIVISTTGDKHA